MAQYGDEYGHVQNQDLDSQAVHGNTDVNMADRANVTHEGKNCPSSGDNPLAQQPRQENLNQSGDGFGEGAIGNKKGFTENIVEKIPVVGRNQEQSCDKNNIADSTTRPGGEGNFAEKKREIMEKIKEKIPSVGDQKEHESRDNNSVVDTTATDDSITIQGGERGFVQKNKEMIENIKEKIPRVGPNDQQSRNTNGAVDKSTTVDSPTIPSEGEVAEQKDEVMDEIKEKVPRVGSNKEQSHDTSATKMPSEKGELGDENKGMIEKIKETLAGHK